MSVGDDTSRIAIIVSNGIIGACLVIVLSVQGCDSGKSTLHQSSGGEQQSDSFAQEIVERRASIEGQLGDSIQDTAVRELIAIAGSTDWGKNNTVDAIVQHYPNEFLSALLIEQKAHDYALSGISERRVYLDTIITQFPEKVAGAKAAELILSDLRGRSIDEFLKQCEEWINNTPRSRVGRVALYEHMRYSTATRAVNTAAIDAMQFWAYHTDAVKRMELESYLRQRLDEAGLFLESAAFLKSVDIPEVALHLIGSMNSGTIPDSNFSNYLASAPSSTVLASHSESLSVGLDKAVFLARLGCLQCYEGQGSQALEAFHEFQNIAEKSLRESPEMASFASAIHLATLRCMIESAEQLAFRSRGTTDQELALSSIRGDLTALANSGRKRFGPLIAGPDLYATFTEHEANILNEIGNPNGAAHIYESFQERYPDSYLAPEMLLKAAELYKTELAAPVKAVKTYLYIAKKYPNTKASLTATFLRALVLVDLEQYAGARDTFFQFMASTPSDYRVPIAKFSAAICVAKLGESDKAVAEIQQVVRDYPNSSIAPDALAWAAKLHLSQQRYDDAKVCLRDLVELYPESDSAREGRTLLDRLKNIPTP